MLNLLPGCKGRAKKLAVPLGGLLSPKIPLIPPPEVEALIKKYDDFSLPLPVVEVREGKEGYLALTLPPGGAIHRANWYNFLALTFMQVSMIEIKVLAWPPGTSKILIRDLETQAQYALSAESLAAAPHPPQPGEDGFLDGEEDDYPEPYHEEEDDYGPEEEQP